MPNFGVLSEKKIYRSQLTIHSDILINRSKYLWKKTTLFFMVSNKDLEKRIENLEKEVKHLKAVLQHQLRNSPHSAAC